MHKHLIAIYIGAYNIVLLLFCVCVLVYVYMYVYMYVCMCVSTCARTIYNINPMYTVLC